MASGQVSTAIERALLLKLYNSPAERGKKVEVEYGPFPPDYNANAQGGLSKHKE